MARRLDLVGCAAIAALAAASDAAVVELRCDDGRPPVAIAASLEGGLIYASAGDLARALGFDVRWIDARQKLVVRAGAAEATFIVLSPIAIVDDIPYNLPAPTLVREGELMVPADQLARLLDQIAPGRLAWDAAARAFTFGAIEVNVRPGTIEAGGDETVITIGVAAGISVRETTEPGWLHLVIPGGRIDAEGFRRMSVGGSVLQVIAAQQTDTGRVSIRIAQGYGYGGARREGESGDVLALSFRRGTPPPAAPATPPPSTRSERSDDAGGIDLDQWAINTVVIDPGHGGADGGARSPVGDEKDLALAIARLVAARLRPDSSINVVLTRHGDEFVSLQERGRIAARANGKLFISIHANANEDPQVSGVETYFLSDAQTEAARQVARMENTALRYEEGTSDLPPGDPGEWEDVSAILQGMASDRFLRESQELARLVQRELVGALGAKDSGVHQAGFYVMKGTLASMPSVLVEIGYLSNPAEARRLWQPVYQRRIADAICRAVREFRSTRERDLNETRPPRASSGPRR